MRSHQLKTQISEEGSTWLNSKYEAVGVMDAGAYRTFLSEDCELQFGNNPIVKCNNEIIGGLQHFWDATNSLDHSFINIMSNDSQIAAEALSDYTRKEGKVVVTPCFTIIERNQDGLASSVRIFIDVAPVFKDE